MKKLLNKLFFEETTNSLIQFIRYGFVGGIAAVVNIGALFIFTDICNINYIISNILAFTLGLTVNYMLSKMYVFKAEKIANKKLEFTIYALIGVIGLGIDTLLLWLFTDRMKIYYLISKLISTALVFIWNFIARKIFYKTLERGSENE